MGIALRDQSGNLRRSEDPARLTSPTRFARIEGPAERVRLAFKLFNSEGVALVMFIPGSHGNGALLAQVVLTTRSASPTACRRARLCQGDRDRRDLSTSTGMAPHRHDHLGIGASAGTFATAAAAPRPSRRGSPRDHQREPGGCHARRSLDHLLGKRT